MSKLQWKMPTFMKPYRKLIEAGCGGQSAETLLNREGDNYFNNPLVCELIGMCQAKVDMLNKMQQLNLLPNMKPEDIERIVNNGT